MATSQKLPSNVIVEGRAVGDFILKSFTSAKGRPLQIVEGQILSGQTFVKVSQFIPAGEAVPALPMDEEKVRCCVVPSLEDDGLLHLNVKFVRPEIVGTVAK